MASLLPADSLVIIYFFYGLAFFTLGLAVALEVQRSDSALPFAQAMLPLAIFGLIHGGHEWLEFFIREAMAHTLEVVPLWLDGLRVVLLAVSFTALVAFGAKLLYPAERAFKSDLYIAAGFFAFWLASVLVMVVIFHPGNPTRVSVRSWLQMADTWSRYSLAIPGSLICAHALWRQARRLHGMQQRFARHLYTAALAFVVYGVIGQLFVSETYLFPSNLVNAALFQQTFGVPIQLLRAVLAAVLALTLIPALAMFEQERRQALADAEQRARDELARREAMRHQMLNHAVAAQEEERQRIARELHDEIGQTLTALTLGLENLLQAANGDETVAQGINDLRQMTSGAVSELHHLVSDLRPSQLDHLGLAAALRSLAKSYYQRFGLQVVFSLVGQRRRLEPAIELAVFRIAQEALTNVVRHAQVDRAEVRLSFEPAAVALCICDKGAGFALPDDLPLETLLNEQGQWGLLGMTERAMQLGGTLTFESAPGQGTTISAWLPLDVHTPAQSSNIGTRREQGETVVPIGGKDDSHE